MTLPKSLIFYGTQLTDDILHLEDEDSGETMDFVTFGEFTLHDCRYIYGMEGDDYDRCFGKHDEKEMEIQFLEIIEDADGNITYSSCTAFTEKQELAIYEIIKHSLESVIAAAKYGVN